MMKRALLFITSLASLNALAVTKVKPIYIGSVGTPREAAPSSDYLTAKGFAFINSDATLIGESSGAIQYTTNSTLRGTMNSSGQFIWQGQANFGNSSAPSANICLAGSTATAGTAPLKFESGTLMTTAEAGAMEYDGSKMYMTTVAAARSSISGVISRTVATNTVVNTVTETDICSISIPASVLGTSGMIRVSNMGAILNNSGGTRAVTYRVRNGSGGVVQMTAAHSVAANVSARAFALEYVFAANNSATVQYTRINTKLGSVGSSGGVSDAVFDEQFATSGTSLNTASTVTLVISVQLAVASASLSYEQRSCIAELL
jgi:hypothetical protein